MTTGTKKAAARENAGSRELAFADATRRLRSGEPGAEADMRAVIEPGIRFFLNRALGTAATPRLLEETLIIACHELRWGRISDATGVVGLVRGVVERQHAVGAAREDRTSRLTGPLRDALEELREEDREALRRFYVNGESIEEILRDSNISVDGFLDLKTRLRALARRTGLRKPARSSPGYLVKRAAAG
jgi:hypothetical protein